MDFGFALESSPPGVTGTPAGTNAALQCRTTRGAGSGDQGLGPRQRISLCVEVFGCLCCRTTPQLEYQHHSGAAVPATLGQGIEQTASPLDRERDPQQDPEMAIRAVLGRTHCLPTALPGRPMASAV